MSDSDNVLFHKLSKLSISTVCESLTQKDIFQKKREKFYGLHTIILTVVDNQTDFHSTLEVIHSESDSKTWKHESQTQ